jgi:hypothetical protein
MNRTRNQKGKAGNPNFKSKWRLGKTTPIRVPEVLADQLLRLAREMDRLNVTEVEQLAEASAIASIQDCDNLSQVIDELQQENLKLQEALTQGIANQKAILNRMERV